MNSRTIRLGGMEIPIEQFRDLVKELGDDADDQQEQDVDGTTANGGVVERRPMGGSIIAIVADFVRRFVFLKEECLYVLIATWILATYIHKEFECMGYLFAYSPERQSGKTKLLDLLDIIVYESTGVQVSPSEAVLFRTAQDHTQLLDEVDSWRNKDNLRDVLNAGYRKGGTVMRCGEAKSGFKPEPYSVYAPRALAGIGISILDSTTLDRTFAIPMVRQRKSEKRERLLQRVIRPEADALKARIQEWVKQKRGCIAKVYARGGFPYLEPFSDRTVEIAEPLAAILEVVYEGSEIQPIRQLFLEAIALTRGEQQSASGDHRLLKYLLDLARQTDPLIGNPSEIAAMCGNLEGGASEHDVSRVLRRYGFKSKSIRLNGTSLRRYKLTRATLEELVERWVPSDGEDKNEN